MHNIKYSNVKIAWHQEKLDALKNGVVTAPIYIRIKPTNRCNHNCFYCSYQNDKRLITTETLNPEDEIPFAKLTEIINDCRTMGVKAITFSGGGEPLLYPRIEDIFEQTLNAGIDLSIITNGQLLSGRRAELLAKAQWVRISLDAGTRTTFSAIREVREELFDALIDNIKAFTPRKDSACELGINYVINHLNHHEIYTAAELFKSCGVNHIKFTARNTPDFHDYHAPFKDAALADIQKALDALTDETFKIHNSYAGDFAYAGVYERQYTTCPIVQIVTIIAADQAVYLCHDKTYSESGKIGSLEDSSLKELWFSENTKKLFQYFNPQASCTHHCTYDQRNMLINEIIETADHHVNFI